MYSVLMCFVYLEKLLGKKNDWKSKVSRCCNEPVKFTNQYLILRRLESELPRWRFELLEWFLFILVRFSFIVLLTNSIIRDLFLNFVRLYKVRKTMFYVEPDVAVHRD